MKVLFIPTVVVLTVLLGCATSSEKSHTTAPDGFYAESSDKSGDYPIQVVPPGGGRALTFRIKLYVGFVPEQVFVFDTPDGYYVQVNGQPTVDEWSKEGIILFANSKPYFELKKSGQAASETGVRFGPSATVYLVLRTRQEAEAVASALRRRFSLPL